MNLSFVINNIFLFSISLLPLKVQIVIEFVSKNLYNLFLLFFYKNLAHCMLTGDFLSMILDLNKSLILYAITFSWSHLLPLIGFPLSVFEWRWTPLISPGNSSSNPPPVAINWRWISLISHYGALTKSPVD